MDRTCCRRLGVALALLGLAARGNGRDGRDLRQKMNGRQLMRAGPFIMLVLGAGLSLQAQTPAEDPRSGDTPDRLPEADANADGAVTMGEAGAVMEDRSERGRADAAKAPQGGKRHVYKNAGGTELPLYVFEPAQHKADARSPAIVFFFGGGWRSGDPSQFEQQCKHLAGRGMVAITVEYRVSSRHGATVEDCIEDAKSAMRWVRSHAADLGVDPDRIAAGGGSAGGHLAACTAVVDDFNAESDPPHVSAAPNAMVLFNPALGLGPGAPGGRDPERERRYRGPSARCTPLTYASRRQAPCIMFYGTEDRHLKGAELYRAASVKAGNACTIVTYEGQPHAFFNYRESGNPYYNLTLAETDRFLADLGWLPRNAEGRSSDPGE